MPQFNESTGLARCQNESNAGGNFSGKVHLSRPACSLHSFWVAIDRQLRAQLNRQEQEKQMVNRRSPASPNDQPGQRSSLSSTGSTVVTSDAYEEPLYSRIDHSDSIDSQTVQANLEGKAP
jgi:hypothetical protein